MEIFFAAAVGVVLLLLVFRRKRPSGAEGGKHGAIGAPPALRRVTENEKRALRELEELAAERSAFDKRYQRALRALSDSVGSDEGAGEEEPLPGPGRH